MTAVEPYLGEETSVQLLLDLEAAGAISPTSLDLSGMEISYDRAEALAGFLGRVKRSSSWWVGDFLIFAEGAYGEKFAQAAAATGLEEQTLLNYSYVCRQIPASRRIAGLPFSVHAEVAALKPREQKYWLDKALKGGWSRAELRARMKAKRKDEAPALPIDDDPPADGLLEEVARAILRDVTRHPDDSSLMIVPSDDIARLEAALGGE